MITIVLLPLIIYFGLQYFQARTVALLLLVFLLLRVPRQVITYLREQSARTSLSVAALLSLMALLWHSDNPLWALSYPVAINALMLGVFAFSLRYPPSIIERFARFQKPDLSPEGVVYTRQVTQVWCGFFIVNGSIAAWTVFVASKEMWALYNGLIAYLFMGALFAGEWLFRRWRFGAEAV